MPARSAPRGRDTRGWFLASDGADAADLFGGVSVHREMKRSQRFVGLGGTVIGIGIGLRGRDTPDHRGRWDAGALRQGTVGRAGNHARWRGSMGPRTTPRIKRPMTRESSCC